MEISKKQKLGEKKEITKTKIIKEKFFKEKDDFQIKKQYEIVVNCLESEEKANRYIKKLKNKNYEASFVIDEKSNCFIIKLGYFLNEKEAKSYLEKIKSEITEDAWIYISMK